LSESIDLAKLRERLSGASGKEYWRSLEDLADLPEFRAFVEREFPAGLHAPQLSRRRFLQLAAASLAMAGLAACSPQSPERLVPYVKQPPDLDAAAPQFYASAHVLNGFATGILVQSHTGRPTHIEGNPDHPANLGATDVFAEASILSLYDPERSQTVLHNGQASTWDQFDSALQSLLATLPTGSGIHILTNSITSASLNDLLRLLKRQFPTLQWHQYDPINFDNVYAGTKLAFGQPVLPVYHLENADILLSLEDDFLFTDPGHLHYTRAFTDRRRVHGENPTMNRLYVTESTPSITGSMADHRLPLRSSDVERFARALAERLGLANVASGTLSENWSRWLNALTDDLQAHPGSSLVTAGIGQPPIVHALAHWINATLGNVGKTIDYIAPLTAEAQHDSLRNLTEAMNSGSVSVLLILGGNPVYTASADVPFADALAKIPFSAHLSLYEDETSAGCIWHLPMSHDLETWADARAYDGTATILQPLIMPFYDTRSSLELLEHALSSQPRDALSIVQQYGQSAVPERDFEAFWRKSLHDGVVPDSAAQPVNVTLNHFTPPTTSPSISSLELIVRPDHSIWDGEFNNNGWLQELPKPFTKLTWDNAALVSPATAQQLGLNTGDLVTLKTASGSVQAPVMILPGQADDCITVTLGYGRTAIGKVGSGTGFNAYPLLVLPTWFAGGLQVEKTGATYPLATTQNHFSMEGRDLIHEGTLDDYLRDPQLGYSEPERQLSLYPPAPVGEYAWGMSIDLNACIGCNACIIACQSENNIPIVGKEQVEAGREMHWLRVDGYFGGDVDDPTFYHQPVPCMHCEQAPCEPVCPVGATVHDSEGINQMVYNRCVGTRYCSNNCPYKVRRFNFFDYSDPDLKILNNPDVTVRSRGVMEKCTYCVQRITHAHSVADREGRRIADGEVKTACQTACPANAIIFGDISDKTSQVAQMKAEARDYALLGELNTRPRTTYLARLTNPNPSLTDTSA
jgi:MoCo/4Fe-4S cofactor protein with predicted Tat translocation signal